MRGGDGVASGCGEKLCCGLIGRVTYCGATDRVAVTFEAGVFGIVEGC